MKALVMQAPWVLTVEEVSTPVPGPDDVLVKVAATGILGSDFHGFSGENGRRKPGQIRGHETVGHVAKVGDNVGDLGEGACVSEKRCSAGSSSVNQPHTKRSVANLPSRLGSLL